VSEAYEQDSDALPESTPATLRVTRAAFVRLCTPGTGGRAAPVVA